MKNIAESKILELSVSCQEILQKLNEKKEALEQSLQPANDKLEIVNRRLEKFQRLNDVLGELAKESLSENETELEKGGVLV
jgi:ABC-type transporter Mla subunit MlaD